MSIHSASDPEINHPHDPKQFQRWNIADCKTCAVVARMGAALILLWIATIPIFAQTSEKMPVPEYFGIYAVDSGQLAALHEGKSSFQPPAQGLNVYSMASGGYTLNAQEFSSNLRFLIFTSTSAETAHALFLYRLAYVRNFLQGNVDQALNPLVFGRQNTKVSTVNSWLAGRLPGTQISLLSKPVAGQPQMIEGVPAATLSPGVYALFNSKELWFQVFTIGLSPTSASADCVDIAFQTGGFGGPLEMGDYFARYGPPAFPEITAQHYKSCGTQTGSVAGNPAGSGNGSASAQPSFSATDCSEYRPCFNKGNEAFSKRQWDQAIAYYERASSLSPTEPGAWAAIAAAYVTSGRYDKLISAGDKVFELGGSMTLPVCHARTMKFCERGNFVIGSKQVSFATSGGNVFAVPANQVITKGTLNFPETAHVAFAMQVGGKKYNFDFLPFFVACQINSFVQCPQEGMEQQLLVANYVNQIIPKLASKSSVASGAQPPAASKPNSPPAGPLRCKQAADLGYSLLASGRLFRVKNLVGQSGGAIHVFIDEKDNPVSDEPLLKQLALGAWTRENIVASAATRAEINSKPQILTDIIGTSQALQRYEMAQDVLARAMVTALEAGVTGGASLSSSVPNLTVGFVRGQFSTAKLARTVLILTGQAGLRMSVGHYSVLKSQLPPADSSALAISDLQRIRELYAEAQGLDLPGEALTVALMPKSAHELTDQALQSALSQLLLNWPDTSANPNEKITLDGLLKAQKELAFVSKDLPAMKSFYENLNLALNLYKANDRTISTWAEEAAACGATVQSAEELSR